MTHFHVPGFAVAGSCRIFLIFGLVRKFSMIGRNQSIYPDYRLVFHAVITLSIDLRFVQMIRSKSQFAIHSKLVRTVCVLCWLQTVTISAWVFGQSDVKLSNPILSGPGNSSETTNNFQNPSSPLVQSPQNSGQQNPRIEPPISRNRDFPSNESNGALGTVAPNSGQGTGQLRGLSNQSSGLDQPRLQVPNSTPPAGVLAPQQHGSNAPLVQPTPGYGTATPTNPYRNQNLGNPNLGGQNFGIQNNGTGFQIPRPSLPNPFGANQLLNRGIFRNQNNQGQTGFSNGANNVPNQGLAENLPEGVEVIRERYNNGAVRIERQVILDQNQNYINHGQWRYYLPNGRVTAQAYFVNGKKSGAWSRWLTIKDTPVLRQLPFNQFQAPFLNTFHYQNDSLQGKWKLQDSANRTIFEIDLQEGKRNGACTWYFVNGQKFQEFHYQSGKLHGTFRKWNTQGKLTEDRKFVEGREIGTITEFHRPGIKKLEYGVLAGEVESLTLDNPWNLEFATEKKIGPDIKNGNVTAWYPNGQVQFTGQFKDDVQHGNFVWYYETGQKQAEGNFANDQRADVWVWWHENGMRASAGRYVAGLPAGNWQWWLADGKLSRTKEFEQDPALVDQGEMKNASFRNGNSK